MITSILRTEAASGSAAERSARVPSFENRRYEGAGRGCEPIGGIPRLLRITVNVAPTCGGGGTPGGRECWGMRRARAGLEVASQRGMTRTAGVVAAVVVAWIGSGCNPTYA